MPQSFRLKAACLRPCGLPSGEDGLGREKRNRRPWRGPADAQRPPHGGDYSALGNERARPLAFPRGQERKRSASLSCHAAQKTAPLHGATPTDALRADLRAQRASGKERGESASGLAQKRRTLRSAAGQSATLEIPAHHFRLLIVTGIGQDLGLGPRQRIELVAVRQRRLGPKFAKLCQSLRKIALRQYCGPAVVWLHKSEIPQ